MNEPVTLFLCGDVMTARGIDQALPYPGDPRLYEPCVENASEYVKLAEQENGPLPRPVQFSYIWGDTLEMFQREKPRAKIINLETAITRSDTYWPSKDVHYKMSPDNIPSLTAAGVDCCACRAQAEDDYPCAFSSFHDCRRPGFLEVETGAGMFDLYFIEDVESFDQSGNSPVQDMIVRNVKRHPGRMVGPRKPAWPASDRILPGRSCALPNERNQRD